jgi:quinoprotein glucose dehydrogenase
MRAARGGGAPVVVTEGRYVTEGFGLYPTIVSPPYTTLTAYDLNGGTIKWQVGLGDDLRLAVQGITGTGSASTSKGGIIPTATGLLFVTAADRKVHVYDSADGTQISELHLGGATTGSPSMYEFGGRQYLLVTASAAGAGGRGGRSAAAADAPGGPTGIIAYALPRN